MTVHLFDNRDVDVTSILFDADRQRFYLLTDSGGKGEDITDQLTQDDKLTIGGDHFDQNYDLRRRSGEKDGGKYPGPGQEPSTSTAEIMTDQVLHDPLQAPLDAAKEAVHQTAAAVADAANKTFQTLANSSGVAAGTIALVLTVGAILFGFYLVKKD